jgi:excisionase family DNA binding protein
MDEYLSPKELKVELRCSLDTIYRRIRDGSLPAYRIGRQWRVKRQDLEALKTGKAATA